eukprot:TRINITY_DN41613_c0_g1_i1.p1 TRINITY_DN41613_c0_g1~~TRINITY_DN41613_c0_g1_i1.p1  ORF type:complete len:115 (+),score=26.06 TRINITY_DN41613_c0_g1_i1:84-428(+)
MIRRPPRSTLSSSSAASDVYKRQVTTLFNTTAGSAHDAVDAVTGRNQTTTSITTSLIGSLGQSLGNCVDSEIIFAGAFMLIIFHIISLFDTQRMLVSRIKSKTYGERFVEMGIR